MVGARAGQPAGLGVVAAVTVSGLTSDEDHAFVIEALDAYEQGQA